MEKRPSSLGEEALKHRSVRKARSARELADLRTVNVVVGIVFDKGRFLAERRKADETIGPGLVCLPGGHVEPKETKEIALAREMREELNIEVKKLRLVKRSFWIASSGERENVYYYLVLEYEGKPICRSAEAVLWIENTGELDIEIDREAVRESRVMFQQAPACPRVTSKS